MEVPGTGYGTLGAGSDHGNTEYVSRAVNLLYLFRYQIHVYQIHVFIQVETRYNDITIQYSTVHPQRTKEHKKDKLKLLFLFGIYRLTDNRHTTEICTTANLNCNTVALYCSTTL